MSGIRFDGSTLESLLSINQTCDLLGLGRTTCYALIAVGDLKMVKLGRLTRVRASSVAALIERSTVPPIDRSVIKGDAS